MIQTLIADIRFVRIGSQPPHLEIRRAEPVVDASGAVCGFQAVGSWEAVITHGYDDPDSYREHVAYSDLAASGGIVDAP